MFILGRGTRPVTRNVGTLTLTLVALVALAAQWNAHADAAPDDPGVFQVSGSLIGVLSELGFRMHQPIGILGGRGPATCEIGERVFLPKADLDGALNRLTRLCPPYRWRREGSSVFLLPGRHVKSILDVKVSSYHVTNVFDQEALAAIHDLPEVKAWFRRNHADWWNLPKYVSGPNPSAADWPKVSLAMSNVRVRDVLDALARSPVGRMRWEVFWSDDDKLLGVSL